MRRLWMLSFLLLLAGCGGKEALHKGKSADQWRQSLHDPDVQARREAITAMEALKDARAVPDLIKALEDSDKDIRAKATEAPGAWVRRRRGGAGPHAAPEGQGSYYTLECDGRSRRNRSGRPKCRSRPRDLLARSGSLCACPGRHFARQVQGRVTGGRFRSGSDTWRQGQESSSCRCLRLGRHRSAGFQRHPGSPDSGEDKGRRYADRCQTCSKSCQRVGMTASDFRKGTTSRHPRGKQIFRLALR